LYCLNSKLLLHVSVTDWPSSGRYNISLNFSYESLFYFIDCCSSMPASDNKNKFSTYLKFNIHPVMSYTISEITKQPNTISAYGSIEWIYWHIILFVIDLFTNIPLTCFNDHSHNQRRTNLSICAA